MGRTFTMEELKKISEGFENKSPQDIIKWVVESFDRDDFALACSFAELTLIDMLVRVKKDARIFYLDTGYLFKETRELVKKAEERYGIKVERFAPLIPKEEMDKKYGPELYKRDPDKCCGILKVEPLKRALSGLKCWITGLRRCESPARANAPIIGWDEKYNLVKVNPIARWTDKEAWDYILANNVPYNELLDKGYPSIGCEPCTSPVEPGEDPRSGRWAGFNKTECGLHK